MEVEMMKTHVIIATVFLSLVICYESVAQSSNGSSIDAPTENQEFTYGVTQIVLEGKITQIDSVANVVTTWPTGQVTTAQVSYGGGLIADQWRVVNSRTDSNGNQTGSPMYLGNYFTELVNDADSSDVWDTRNYKVLSDTSGGSTHN